MFIGEYRLRDHYRPVGLQYVSILPPFILEPWSEAPMRRWKHSPAPSKPLSEAMDPWFLMISGADQWEMEGNQTQISE